MIKLRLFAPEDTKAVVALWERSRWDSQPWLEERMGYTHGDNLEFFETILIANNTVWVASEGGNILAFMALHEAEINSLYVDPAFHRRGVGSALINKARELSPGGLTLFTPQRNERARRFYEKLGFTVVSFGISAAPESEPDVKYAWQPEP